MLKIIKIYHIYKVHIYQKIAKVQPFQFNQFIVLHFLYRNYILFNLLKCYKGQIPLKLNNIFYFFIK